MNKKRFFTTNMALPLAACAFMMFGACSNKKSADSAGNDDAAFTTDSIAWADSVTTPGGNNARCDITVDWPSGGNAALLDSIRTWIAARLTTSPSGNPGDTISAPLPADCLADGKKLLATIGDRTLFVAKAELTGLDSLGMEPPMGYEYSWSVTENYRSEKAVTYGALNYVYLGGAHGGTSFSAQTFSLEDGAELGWNMFLPDSLGRVRELVKEGIMKQYFEAKTEADFRDALLVNPDTLPLPASAPYFMANGVNFNYQQYEIAPYSEGMPACVLPYSAVKPLLTPTAAALLPAE